MGIMLATKTAELLDRRPSQHNVKKHPLVVAPLTTFAGGPYARTTPPSTIPVPLSLRAPATSTAEMQRRLEKLGRMIVCIPLVCFLVTYPLATARDYDCYKWPNNCVPSNTIAWEIKGCYFIGLLSLTAFGVVGAAMVTTLHQFLQQIADTRFPEIRRSLRNTLCVGIIAAFAIFLAGVFPTDCFRWIHGAVSQTAFVGFVIYAARMLWNLGKEPFKRVVNPQMHFYGKVLLRICAICAILMPVCQCMGVYRLERVYCEKEPVLYVACIIFTFAEISLILCALTLLGIVLPRMIDVKRLD